jgi:hypothetical protein
MLSDLAHENEECAQLLRLVVGEHRRRGGTDRCSLAII